MNKFWVGVVVLLVSGVGNVRADIDARIYWGKRIDMGVPVSGVVAKVPVDAGMRVGKGDELLVLQQTPFKTAMIEAKAGVVQAAGARKIARRDYDQTKDLYDRGLISTVELQNAQLKKEAKEAAYTAARAKLERAQYELAHSVLRAPFDGLVLEKRVEAGQTLVSTQQVQTVLTFAASGDYIARGKVDSKQVKDLAIGQKATVKANGKSFSGQISSLGLEPVAGSKPNDPKYEISVRFHSSDVMLRAGTEASITF
ncbi:MAG: efflux RND transporter periplasmic adaptor subunit [Acidiferrobacterales bacterium]